MSSEDDQGRSKPEEHPRADVPEDEPRARMVAVPSRPRGGRPRKGKGGTSEPWPTLRPRKVRPPPGIITAGGVDMARAHAVGIEPRISNVPEPIVHEPRVVVTVETNPTRVPTQKCLVLVRAPAASGAPRSTLPSGAVPEDMGPMAVVPAEPPDDPRLPALTVLGTHSASQALGTRAAPPALPLHLAPPALPLHLAPPALPPHLAPPPVAKLPIVVRLACVMVSLVLFVGVVLRARTRVEPPPPPPELPQATHVLDSPPRAPIGAPPLAVRIETAAPPPAAPAATPAPPPKTRRVVKPPPAPPATKNTFAPPFLLPGEKN
jgi:hypothetical protein